MADSHLELADYRRRVAELYQAMRAAGADAEARLSAFRRAKDALFRSHPQSPVPAAKRAAFEGLDYWPYRPELSVTGSFTAHADTPEGGLPRSGGGKMSLRHIGEVTFELLGDPQSLGVYWFEEYAGGIFIPFRDATGGDETYAGGRYLWDSAKGADLGTSDGELTLDFNYACHPSCTYDPRWSCPLAPPGNRLAVPIRAGERLSPDR